MKLTRTERLILANQYRILAKVEPWKARDHQRAAQALSSGFDSETDELLQQVVDDGETLTREECMEVWEILKMHQDLKWSFETPADQSEIDPLDIEFMGFDANSEGQRVCYCQYLCAEDTEHPAFADLNRGDCLPRMIGAFNSRVPTLEMYRRMLPVWKSITEHNHSNFTKEEVQALLAAARPRPRPGPFPPDPPEGWLTS